jgi:hypothetical protein
LTGSRNIATAGRRNGNGNECEGYENDQEKWDEVRFRVAVGKTAVLSDGRAVVRVRDVKDAWSKKL